MKFTVAVKDKRIRDLFKFNCDYLDVFVNKKVFILFAEVSDMFAILTMNIGTMEDYIDEQIFRIPKAGFFSLIQEGILTFLCQDDSVYMRVENAKIMHSMRFDKQICNISKLEEKLDLIRKAPSYPKFAVHDLILPAKILKNSKTALTIRDRTAFSSVNGLHLYAKTQCSDCALFPSVLNHLVAVCDGAFDCVFDVRDNIIFSDGTCHVIINKVSSSSEGDIDAVLSRKATYKAKVNFEQAIQLLSKIRDYTEVDLNLRRQELILRSKDIEYSTRIFVTQPEESSQKDLSVEELLSSDVAEIPLIKFPAEVFKNIIYAVKSKSLDIVCSKELVRVSVAKGLMFVCRKEIAEL